MLLHRLCVLALLCLSASFVFIPKVAAVDQRKFRTCSETAFCQRLRVPIPERLAQDETAALDDPATLNIQSRAHYDIALDSVKFSPEDARITAKLTHRLHPKQAPLDLSISILKHGIVRLLVDEQPTTRKYERWHVRDVTQQDAMQPFRHDKQQTTKSFYWQHKKSFAQLQWHVKHQATQNVQTDSLVLEFAPFRLVVMSDGKPLMMINSRNLMRFEQYRDANPRPTEQRLKPKPEPVLIDSDVVPELGANQTVADGDAGAASQVTVEPVDEYETVDAPDQPESEVAFAYDTPGMWSETFGGHTDVKKRGPAAVGMDIDFMSTNAIYGLPEHASDFALRSTRGRKAGEDYVEPFRLYNLDVFEYDLDVPMALYGAVPFVVGHAADRTMGVLWLNAAETFVDVDDSIAQGSLQHNKNVHFMSESGVIDMYLLPGSEQSATTVFTQYAHLTGFPMMPPRFATAYHQCRWNYKSEADVAQVNAGFNEHDIPYDVMWLDIEHTDGKKYMTWDAASFPNPIAMQDSLAAEGRKLVTIVDPHIKRDAEYKVHTQAQALDYYIHKPDGTSTYEGWCWPGSVSYLDFMLEEVRAFWHKALSFDQYVGSTSNLHVWNDMNEPSVFNGPEVTMPKDCTHLNGTVEHRDVHNTYGYYVSMSTAQGLVKRDAKRPFVLTRSFFAGYQRFGAVWTGDNAADWSHLEAAQPMLLSLGVAGITFSGADVGGFFGDPSDELLTRWYQAAAYQPFFRAHAHIDAKRREPWLAGEPHTSRRRAAIVRRYQLLPYIYSLFFVSHTSGLAIMRPVWLEFPTDASQFEEQHSFMLGPALLVHPIVAANTESIDVLLPRDAANTQLWYRLSAKGEQASPLLGGQSVRCESPIDEAIPVFQRGGTIVTEAWRLRRSSAQMADDPLTLVIALDAQGSATGDVYIDDGESYAYRDARQFAFTRFTMSQGVIRNQVTGNRESQTRIERIVIRGPKDQIAQWQTALVNQESTQIADAKSPLTRDDAHQTLTVRAPNVRLDKPFTIQLQ